MFTSSIVKMGQILKRHLLSPMTVFVLAAKIVFWNNYNSFCLVVLGPNDFLSSSSSSSAWPQSELRLDEDSSGLDYMLALSLQSDGESVAGGMEGNLWSGIWDHKIGKTSNTSINSPLSPPNNNYPNFTTGTSTSAVQELDQAGELVLIRILWVVLLSVC